MASPFQHQALQRKVLYIVLILVLLTASWAVRVFLVEPKAELLSLREQNVGEVDVTGAAVQLSLTGSRGLVVCGLWYWAADAQKKNRWNELELYVRSLTKLQPHFITPWLFQSWNLAYNVSVEADQVKDKIFYVYRGTELLAEGERKNRNHPEMRFSVGFYQQHKIMISDETNVFRCLYQMASIPPKERDPDRFYKPDDQGRKVFDKEEFAKFCEQHPQLVRRLHDRLRKSRPEDVVQFLEDNKRVPSLYSDDRDEIELAFRNGAPAPLKAIRERWPILPPPRKLEAPQQPYTLPRGTELTYESLDQLTDEFDAYLASRAWYGYAQEPLPGTDPDRPGKPTAITNPVLQRTPRMTVALFRNYPPRAQSYVGERLEQEGWFDGQGWEVDWFPGRRFGTDRNSAREACDLAHAMWEQHGRYTGLYLDPIPEETKRAEAKKYWADNNMPPGAEPPPRNDLKPADSEYDRYKSATYIHWFDYYRTLTNFPHHYYRAEVEAKKETVEARRAFFEAERLRTEGKRVEALDRYERKEFKGKDGKPIDALESWRETLKRFANFRNDDWVQEDSYETQLRYVVLLEDVRGTTYKQAMSVGNALLEGAMPPGPGWPANLVGRVAWPLLPLPDVTPAEDRRFDNSFKHDPNDASEPVKELVKPQVAERVLVRNGRRKPFEPTPEERERMMEEMKRRQPGSAPFPPGGGP